MAFWGVVLKPGASKGVEQSQGDVMHLSQACLHDPKDGKNYLMAKVGNASYSLACLEKGKKEHDTFDLFFSSEDCTFVNKGQSEMHLTGYFEPDGMGDDEDDESEDVQPTKGKAAAATSPKAVATSSPKLAAASSVKQSPKIAPAKAAAAAAASDSDEDEDEESEEEIAAAKAAAGLDDDSDDFEDEESEEESAPPPPKKAKTGAPAAVAVPPAKKAAAGSPAEKWASAIQAYLKKNGKKTISEIANSNPRPADVPKMKMKQLFEQHKDKFTLAGETVSAK